MITFKADDTIAQLKDWAKLSRGRVETATAKALNSAANAAKKHVVAEIPRKYSIKKDEVAKRFRLTKADETSPATRQAATFKIKDVPIPLARFNSLPWPVNTARGPRVGVVAKISSSTKLVAHSFFAKVGKGGHVGIFARRGAARLPIREKWGPSVAQIVKTAFIEAMVTISRKTFAELLPKELKRQQRKQDAGP